MKLKIFFIIFIVFCGTIFGQGNEKEVSELKVASRCFMYQEINPSEKEMSDSIIHLFLQSIENYKSQARKEEYIKQQIEILLNLLFENAQSFYADSDEERRMKVRRAAIYASLALLSDSDKGLTFIDYSKRSLQNEACTVTEYLEETYLGVLILENLIKMEAGFELDVDYLNVFTETQKENISEETLQLLGKLTNN